MLKISKKDYQDAIAYLHGIKDANYRVFFFEEVEVVVAEDGRKIYINDRTGERSKFYKLDSEAIISIYMVRQRPRRAISVRRPSNPRCSRAMGSA